MGGDGAAMATRTHTRCKVVSCCRVAADAAPKRTESPSATAAADDHLDRFTRQIPRPGAAPVWGTSPGRRLRDRRPGPVFSGPGTRGTREVRPRFLADGEHIFAAASSSLRGPPLPASHGAFDVWLVGGLEMDAHLMKPQDIDFEYLNFIMRVKKGGYVVAGSSTVGRLSFNGEKRRIVNRFAFGVFPKSDRYPFVYLYLFCLLCVRNIP